MHHQFKCDGKTENWHCDGEGVVTTKSGLHLCRDCAVDYGGEFATPLDENRVRWFIESLTEEEEDG